MGVQILDMGVTNGERYLVCSFWWPVFIFTSVFMKFSTGICHCSTLGKQFLACKIAAIKAIIAHLSRRRMSFVKGEAFHPLIS